MKWYITEKIFQISLLTNFENKNGCTTHIILKIMYKILHLFEILISYKLLKIYIWILMDVSTYIGII